MKFEKDIHKTIRRMDRYNWTREKTEALLDIAVEHVLRGDLEQQWEAITKEYNTKFSDNVMKAQVRSRVRMFCIFGLILFHELFVLFLFRIYV